MGERLERAKASLSGKKKNSRGTRLAESVITGVGSFLKTKPRYIVTVPKGRSFGKAFYTVQSGVEPITFTKKKDAVAYQKLLKASTKELSSDIVRHEITDDGYFVGEENV